MLLNRLQDRIELDSRLTELSRVQPWIEELADQFGFNGDTRFAIQLCVEEALANVVMHGYRNEPGHPIVIRSSVSAHNLFFIIEDQAPSFAPVEPAPPGDATTPVSLESIEPGGNGIRLLYRFAGSLAYERFADGNRLTIGFPIPFQGVSV
jgi:serine/threonine-protein kinase RsbW